MRKFAASALAIMAVVMLATPAVAEPTWEPTKCWAGAPYNSQVKTQIGPGNIGPLFYYRNVYAPGTDAYGKPLFGQALWYYLNAGADCGRFGLLYNYGLVGNPTTGAVSYYWWYFVTPGSCNMRYVITLAQNNQATGTTYEGTANGYFCQ